MSRLLQLPLVRLALVCAALVLAVFVVVDPTEDPAVRADDADTVETSAPSAFGSAPTTGTGVVEVDGIVLPIVGGEPGAWEVLTPCARRAVVDGEPIAGAHVVLDPGHGGEETGAVARNGLSEAELNLDVARRTAQVLEDAGASVVLTRDREVRVTLETRAAIAMALDPLVFLSIHHNGGPTEPAPSPGVQVYHQVSDPESKRLGGIVFEALRERMTPLSETWSAGNAVGVRPRLDAEGGDFYGVLRGATGIPSVLVEALYMSSEPEATLLTEPEVRRTEATAIADAVVAWLDTDRPGSGYLGPLQAEESPGGGGGQEGCEDPAGLGA